MVPFMQSTLIAHGIDKIRPHIENIHVTVGYKGAMLAAHLIEHAASSVHNTDGRSNSWWLHNSLLQHLDEPIFVLTCDNITDINFKRLADDYFSLGEPPCLLLPVAPVSGLDGDYIFHEGSVVTELSRTKTADIYCSGIQVLNPKRVRDLTSGTGDFSTVWSELIAQRKLYVSSVWPDKWFSVDTLEQLERLAPVSVG
jgi:NDP-sugar pyrophosphorylase family protein